MMGSKQRQFAPSIHVALEDLVPAYPFYRHLERTLDLSFVREFVEKTFAGWMSHYLPDHSSPTRIRERYSVEAFRRFFEKIVERCQAAGLVWGKEPYIDAPKVKANAPLESLTPRFAVEVLFSEGTQKSAEQTEQAASPKAAVSGESIKQEKMEVQIPLPVSLSPLVISAGQNLKRLLKKR